MVETARERAVRSLRSRLPELGDVVVLHELGSGLDNRAFAAGDLVVRVAEGHSVIREGRLLQVLAARLSLPVPAPRFIDEDAAVLAYPRIPGQPLLGRDPAPGSAARIGRFLRELHDVTPDEVAGLADIDEADPRGWLEGIAGPPELVAILHDTIPSPANELVVAHADLGAEHILALHGQITGIIDWSDAAITDPAVDFARLYRDFGPSFLTEALEAYGDLGEADASMARIEFFARYAALEDLAYGQASGRSDYRRPAEHSIDRLFPRSR